MKGRFMRVGTRIKSLYKGNIKRGFYAVLVVIGLFLIGAASHDIMTGELEYQEARTEYDSIRELYPVISMFLPQTDGSAPGVDSGSRVPGSVSGQAALGDSDGPVSRAPVSEQEELLAGLKEINSDFIGWIYIEDVLDYPVVRGPDNDLYLDKTFSRKSNPAGAIFMDSRNSSGFGDPVCVLYGHNMKDGTMFAKLHKYRDSSFMADHPYVYVVTLEGEVLFYKIYAVKYEVSRDLIEDLSYARNAATASEFRNAPEGSSHFLILSTCANSSENTYGDDRLRIFAALVG